MTSFICISTLATTTMASTDIVTKRIHVGGLTPNITTSHIKDRFKSFGNVLEVEELKADALGK